MHLHTRNVNTAFRELVNLFAGHDTPGPYTKDWEQKRCPVVRRPSRNGDVLVIDEPVTITYSHPRERVLFNPARDLNPFAFLYHSLWMLAGRNDLAGPAHYLSRMRNYSDDGVTLNGAYGYRWRHALSYSDGRPEGCNGYVRDEVDQLDVLVKHLKADPTSRRAVLQMWNVEDDLLKIGPKVPRTPGENNEPTDEGMLQPYSLDVCCNLSVLFTLREYAQDLSFKSRRDEPPVPIPGTETVTPVYALDMTVLNRSNDLIWGALGEDYLTFSLLQEYVAARLGAGVGRYHHVSNNLHVYTGTGRGTAHWTPEEWLRRYKSSMVCPDCDPGHDPRQYVTRGSCEKCGKESNWLRPVRAGRDAGAEDAYTAIIGTVPLVKDPSRFDVEVKSLVGNAYGDPQRIVGTLPELGLTEPFLQDVAGRLFTAHALHRLKDDHGAFMLLAEVPADDWRVAAEGWLRRRAK